MSTLERSAENLEALKRVFSCIDNTTLEGCDTHQHVQQLCQRSIELQDAGRGINHVAAVCVYPVFFDGVAVIGHRPEPLWPVLFQQGSHPSPLNCKRCNMRLTKVPMR